MMELKFNPASNTWDCKVTLGEEKLTIGAATWKDGNDRNVKFVDFKIDIGTSAFLQCEVFTELTADELGEFCKCIARTFKDTVEYQRQKELLNVGGKKLRLSAEEVLWAAQSAFGRKKCNVFVKEGEDILSKRQRILAYAQFKPGVLPIMDKTIICRNTDEETGIPEPMILFAGTRADMDIYD